MTNTIRYYLAAYNLTAFTFWFLFLAGYFASGYVLTDTNLLLLNIAQGLAVLEIVHALLRWVKSPLASTTAQVFSRILVLVLINVFIKNTPLHFVTDTGILIVSLAWSITELVRYSLYFLQPFGKQPDFLIWMRYSFFVVLYPLGVTGEWLILITPLAVSGITLSGYTVFLTVAAVAYVYYFPILYKYMWKQRKTKLQ